MGKEFTGLGYNPLSKNCNHFCDAFTRRVLQKSGKVIPNWVNRLSSIGSFCSCLLPLDKLGMKLPRGKNEDEEDTNLIDEPKIEYFSGEGHTLVDTKSKNTKKFEEPLDINERRKLFEEAAMKRMEKHKDIDEEDI
eukprot:TRINITY_DN4279_c0_g1_i1.p1 TRINITY_DN4279_c0_g1~~TRINITY_DN4279_c0_g1_i1.p1  ORF type:complete len:136 (+),score=31.82 TRINITY_DN4279_c0_g1_i1:307-714(+)